ncbi:hypothetical protein K7432_001513 [Basidiobolus ranarum]|uniref:RNA methyltransferase n=1 Tax=Basidiobolus ranarum TaxID=34480 RepID=A0ABR2X2Z1_9FUNG
MSTNPYLEHVNGNHSKKRNRIDLSKPRKKILGSKASSQADLISAQSKKNTTVKEKEKKKKYINGNYPQYYGYRNRKEDPRLELFQKWIEGKSVLDIGCNAGYVTVELALRYRPKEILGVDIDESLIAKCWAHLKHQANLLNSKGEKKPQEMVNESECLPQNISFRTSNWVLEHAESLPQYQVILCLSVTKWIHLNQGDEGIKQLFQKAYDSLTDNGVLVLEPQPWSSYYRRSHLTPVCISYVHFQLDIGY